MGLYKDKKGATAFPDTLYSWVEFLTGERRNVAEFVRKVAK